MRSTRTDNPLTTVLDGASIKPATVAAAAVALVVLAAVAVLASAELLSFDQRVALWFDRHTDPLLVTAMLYITQLGSALTVTVASIGVGLYLVVYRSWRRLWVWLLMLPCGALLNEGLKLVFQRTRPALPHAALHLADYSFPSGHSASTALLYGGAAVFFAARLDRRGGRVATAVAATAIVLAVGLSRMVLGVHYLTDVVAGITFGSAWMGVCLRASQAWRPATRNPGAPRRSRDAGLS